MHRFYRQPISTPDRFRLELRAEQEISSNRKPQRGAR
jgi:hypothetical protein